MNKYFPSRKFIFTLLSIIIALGIIYAFYLLKNKQATIEVESNTEKIAKMQEFMALDSDGDGMRDWEESLWKTDPKNSDTDLDGTSDGEEAKLNRDPLQRNINPANQIPSDLIDEALIASAKKTQEEFENLTETEKVARTFFSQYIASKSVNPLDSESKQFILDTAISMAETSNDRLYVKTDIKITSDTSSESLKRYGNALGKAFLTGTAENNVENEIIIMQNVMQTNNEEALKRLDPIIESYQKTIDKILAIDVPENAVILNLNFLNDLNLLKNSLKKMQLLFSDPIQAMAGIGNYQMIKASIFNDLINIKNYFTDRGISFTTEEYGYIMLNII